MRRGKTAIRNCKIGPNPNQGRRIQKTEKSGQMFGRGGKRQKRGQGGERLWSKKSKGCGVSISNILQESRVLND